MLASQLLLSGHLINRRLGQILAGAPPGWFRASGWRRRWWLGTDPSRNHVLRSGPPFRHRLFRSQASDRIFEGCLGSRLLPGDHLFRTTSCSRLLSCDFSRRWRATRAWFSGRCSARPGLSHGKPGRWRFFGRHLRWPDFCFGGASRRLLWFRGCRARTRNLDESPRGAPRRPRFRRFHRWAPCRFATLSGGHGNYSRRNVMNRPVGGDESRINHPRDPGNRKQWILKSSMPFQPTGSRPST
jgi:hypothetical protein